MLNRHETLLKSISIFADLAADELAVAMESRCYRGEGRTRLRQPVLRPVDWIVLVVGSGVALAVAILL